MMRLISGSWMVVTGAVLFAAVAACGTRSADNSRGAASAGSAAAPATAAAQPASAGPIDVCRVVTAADAAGVLGPLPPQPPASTDNVGFGVRSCMYVGPKLSGQGAQTVFTRLTVQAGSGKGPGDMLQADVDRRHATIDLPGVGDSAKRSPDGSFVWATRADVFCTAEISNGLPAGLSPDAAASKLAEVCRKIFAGRSS